MPYLAGFRYQAINAAHRTDVNSPGHATRSISAYSSFVTRNAMFLVFFVSLFSLIVRLRKMLNVSLTAVNGMFADVNNQFLSLVFTCVNKINAAFTNVNAQP